MNPAVMVVQEQVPPYRVPFFRLLSGELTSYGLDLRVVSSSALPATAELGFQHRRVPTSRYGRPALEIAYRERPAALVLPHSGRVAPVAAATRLAQAHRRKQLFWGMGLARRYGTAAARDRRPVAEAVRRPDAVHL